MVKNSKSRKHSIISISIKLSILAILVIGILFVYIRSEVNFNRILITDIIENQKQPAVIDAKTGDKYFPPEKLFLPYAPNQPALTYSVQDNGSGGTEFTISSKSLLGALHSKMHFAQTQNALFRVIPELQACSRGIRLTYKILPNDDIPSVDSFNLNSSHVLKNGKTIYIYSEKVCTQLDELAVILKNIQSY